MRLRLNFGLPLALLLLSSCAMADRSASDQAASQSTQTQPQMAANAAPRTVADKEYGKVQVVGARQVGTAAWYGGRYVGRRTSSGSTLDRVHATAAHRSLPLNSLVRVTNLKNGRSVVVRVTDRGPVSASLLIDVSPSAADDLDMKTAGLVPVAVEQVVEVPADAK